MQKHQTRLTLLGSCGLALLILFLLIMQRVQAQQMPTPTNTNARSTPPIIGRQIILYDPGLATGDLGTQAFTYSNILGPSAVATFDPTDRLTILDTTAMQGEAAGYGIIGDLLLDRTQGYMLRFAVQVVSEHHSSADRAGFSVIALGSDKSGVEVGFWENEVWAQEGGSGSSLFTHAEGALFDTTGSHANEEFGPLTQYELHIKADTYSISAARIPLNEALVQATHLLSGTVRNYTAFNGFPDVYETENFLFFGDNTSRGQAEVKLGMITAIVAEPPTSRTITAGLPLNIDDLGIIVDATESITMTISALEGDILVSTAIIGGIPPQSVSTGANPIIVTNANAINTTFAHPSGLIYQSPTEFSGMDTITVAIDTGEQIAEQLIQVQVVAQATPTLMPTSTPASTPTPLPGTVNTPPPGPLYLPFVTK